MIWYQVDFVVGGVVTLNINGPVLERVPDLFNAELAQR
jgi:hypothetical protein